MTQQNWPLCRLCHAVWRKHCRCQFQLQELGFCVWLGFFFVFFPVCDLCWNNDQSIFFSSSRSMLICCVYPQLIIITSLTCRLISYKQVQVVQVLPIDPLKTPIVTRPLSSHTEQKNWRHRFKSISLLWHRGFAKVYTSAELLRMWEAPLKKKKKIIEREVILCATVQPQSPF